MVHAVDEPELPVPDVLKRLGAMWSALSDDDKAPYQEQAAYDKIRVEELKATLPIVPKPPKAPKEPKAPKAPKAPKELKPPKEPKPAKEPKEPKQPKIRKLSKEVKDSEVEPEFGNASDSENMQEIEADSTDQPEQVCALRPVHIQTLQTCWSHVGVAKTHSMLALKAALQSCYSLRH